MAEDLVDLLKNYPELTAREQNLVPDALRRTSIRELSLLLADPRTEANLNRARAEDEQVEAALKTIVSRLAPVAILFGAVIVALILAIIP